MLALKFIVLLSIAILTGVVYAKLVTLSPNDKDKEDIEQMEYCKRVKQRKELKKARS